MAWWVPILAAITAAGAAGAGGAGAAGAAGGTGIAAAAPAAAGGGGSLSALQGGASALPLNAAPPTAPDLLAGPPSAAAGAGEETGLSKGEKLQRAAALVGSFLPTNAPPSPPPPQIPFDPRRLAPGVESRQTRGYR